MRSRVHLFLAFTIFLTCAMMQTQAIAAEDPPSVPAWAKQKVSGRDAVLRDIEARALENSERVVYDARRIMYDFEVDLFRLVLRVGKRYGMDIAWDIQSEGVKEKRLRWLDQQDPSELVFPGTEVEKGLALYKKYFKTRDDEFELVELSENKVVFKRMDYVNAIFHASDTLGLDPVEVMNRVYAEPMTLVLDRVVPGLKYSVLKYEGDGWYEEMIEFIQPDE